MIRIVQTTSFADQKPGTSGLRKKVRVFQQKNYVENFIQSVFDTFGDVRGQTIVVGGDGRYLNNEAIVKMISMAAANGFARVIVGQGGILSTPASSHVIRKYKALGGLIFSASHNPAGPEGDFGIKINVGNGGSAPEKMTEAVFERSKMITSYKCADCSQIDTGSIGSFKIEETIIEVIDPVADYVQLMESLFDFLAIQKLFESGFRMIFDAMHAVTGPYAQEILERRLGAAAGSVRNHNILSDFGGLRPEPDPFHAKELLHEMMSQDAPDFGAASDGDGDRNMILGKGIFVSASDSLAILAANAHLVSAFRQGIKGIAHSMPTSRAVDRVAQRMGVDLYETPTGWKFFVNLLESGKVSICGEESFGTGANHIREKDGLWAVLLWLNILAIRRETVSEIVKNHWQAYGRDYHARHDYENLETSKANSLFAELLSSLSSERKKEFRGMKILHAGDFVYHDPVDHSVSENQGIRILFHEGSRLVFRISGTETSGSTLRVYIEKWEPDPSRQELDEHAVLAELVAAAREIGRIEEFTGRKAPDLII